MEETEGKGRREGKGKSEQGSSESKGYSGGGSREEGRMRCRHLSLQKSSETVSNIAYYFFPKFDLFFYTFPIHSFLF